MSAPRPPHVAPGSQAFVWAIVFAVYTWLLMLGVGVSNAVSALVGALVGGASFLLVRNYGEDLTRSRRGRRTGP